METKLLTYDDLVWPLGQQDSSPRYEVGTETYLRSFRVDPYPCYTHDFELVKQLVNDCEETFPLTGTQSAVYVLSHEDIERVNGTTFSGNVYKGKSRHAYCKCGCNHSKVEFYPLATYVTLSGKRTPIHPAVTRYLVTHEYGHMVWNHVCRMLDYIDEHEKELYRLYMELRGVKEYIQKYKGKSWHLNPGEIVANDFRVIFMNQEREFWPHPGVPLPEDTPIMGWWKEVHEKAMEYMTNPSLKIGGLEKP